MDIAKFSERLKHARNEAKMTQLELAEKAGMSQGKISIYESEKNSSIPSLAAAGDIAQALNISLDWLAGVSDKPKVDIEASERDFLKYLLSLLLHDEAEVVNKSNSNLNSDGLYIHFPGKDFNLFEADIYNLFKLRNAIKSAEVPEDTAEAAISAAITKILDKYENLFFDCPF